MPVLYGVCPSVDIQNKIHMDDILLIMVGIRLNQDIGWKNFILIWDLNKAFLVRIQNLY